MDIQPLMQKKWHVIYTRSRAEKKVRDELVNKNIECFLPIQKKLRRWKDRKKWVEMPLISGYCFVHITRKDYDNVLQTENVVCYITFEGKAAEIPERQIEYLQRLSQQAEFEVTVSREKFEPGQKVEVMQGPMVGMRGELVRSQGKQKFILRLNEINSSFIVEIPASHLSNLPAAELSKASKSRTYGQY